MKALPEQSSSNIAARTRVRCFKQLSRCRSTSLKAQPLFKVGEMSAQMTSSMKSTTSSTLGYTTANCNTESSGQDTRMIEWYDAENFERAPYRLREFI